MEDKEAALDRANKATDLSGNGLNAVETKAKSEELAQNKAASMY